MNKLINFLSTAKIDSIQIGSSSTDVICSLGNMEERVNGLQKLVIYMYFGGILQITIYQERVYLIAIELSQVKKTPVNLDSHLEFLREIDRFYKIDDFIQICKDNGIELSLINSISDENSKVFKTKNNITIVFENGELESLQVGPEQSNV